LGAFRPRVAGDIDRYEEACAMIGVFYFTLVGGLVLATFYLTVVRRRLRGDRIHASTMPGLETSGDGG
jgi:hypothetical protein